MLSGEGTSSVKSIDILGNQVLEVSGLLEFQKRHMSFRRDSLEHACPLVVILFLDALSELFPGARASLENRIDAGSEIWDSG